MISDDDLTARLSKVDPAASTAGGPETLDALLADVRSQPLRRRRRLGLVTTLTVGGLIAVGAGALPAAAAIRSFLAEFVEGPPPSGSEVIEGYDWIDTTASDIPDLVASRYPDNLRLPNGIDRQDVVDTITYSISNMGGITQEIAVDQAYEGYFYCRWVDVWLASDSADNQSDRDYAARIMVESATWTALVASDGGGVVQSREDFGEAAVAGDRSEVQKAYDYNACAGWKSMGQAQ